jgi:DNA-binding transcriptional LysR family regulator
MYLHQLRIFAAVAELGNVTQAAKRLNLSQPAASEQIKSLEEELGTALFDRRRKRLVLTHAGASLLPTVQHALTLSNDVIFEARRLSGHITGPIRLACAPAAFDKSFFPLTQMLQLIIAHHPELNVDLHQRSSPDIWSGVAEGAFDLGLAFGARDLPNVHRILLRNEPYRIVAPGTWDSSVRGASWQEMQELTWITCTTAGKHHDMATQLFRRFDCRPGKIIRGDSEQVISGLVTAGMGIGLMRESLALPAQATGKLFIIDKARPAAQFHAIFQAARENDPAIRAVVHGLSACSTLTKECATSIPTERRQRIQLSDE